jgi:DNA polymerase-3 subunit delta'
MTTLAHQPRAEMALNAALKAGPSHAYLFRGPRGAGKRAAARAFAAEILAGAAEDAEDARRRALLDPSPHPDLVWIAPKGAQHMVEEVRERVIRAAAYRPYEGGKRVFVVEAAEAMRDESQNALLKTLEEPPEFVHLILLTSEPAALLETIASRCQPVDFAPLPAEAVEAALRGGEAGGEGGEDDGSPATATRDEIAAAARLAAGDVELARLLLSEPGRKLRGEAEGFAAAALAGEDAGPSWRAMLKSAEAAGEEAETAAREALEEEKEAGMKRSVRDIADAAKRAGRGRRTELLDLGLALAAAWFRDLGAVACGAAELAYNRDRVELLRAQAGGEAQVEPPGGARSAAPGPDRARRAVELVEDTRRRLDLNVSEELALEALQFRLERTVSDAVVRRPRSPE